jgi:hypothetical protein
MENEDIMEVDKGNVESTRTMPNQVDAQASQNEVSNVDAQAREDVNNEDNAESSGVNGWGESSQKSGARKASVVWDHFEKFLEEGKKKARCMHCKKGDVC